MHRYLDWLYYIYDLALAIKLSASEFLHKQKPENPQEPEN
jgi:hypothetical protein